MAKFHIVVALIVDTTHQYSMQVEVDILFQVIYYKCMVTFLNEVIEPYHIKQCLNVANIQNKILFITNLHHLGNIQNIFFT